MIKENTMNEIVSDSTVDFYRDILKVKTTTAEQAKRGSCGVVGKGTAGSRLKSARPSNESLRTFVRRVNKDGKHERHVDSITWMRSKGMRP